MNLFDLKVRAYKARMSGLKAGGKVLPFKEPELFTGPGSAEQLCVALATKGHSRTLIVTDKVLVEIGVVGRITAYLDQAGVDYVIYDGVLPDPAIEQVDAGFAMYEANNCDSVLAVGGGSSMDAAKVVALRATNDKPVRKMEGLFKIWHWPAPLYAIPTTAGTGSETTLAAVVSDTERMKKMSVIDFKMVPKMAALDGALMTGIPKPITAATGMDALTHAVEAYISRNATEATDAKALAATETIMEYLPQVMADPANEDLRQQMAQGSYDAGVAFTQAGVGYVHAVSHQLGAHYHTPHGLANAIVLPYVLDFSKPACANRLADLARASGMAKGSESDDELADAFIARIREMNATFDIPTTLDALQREDIPAITKAALAEAHATYAVPRYMDTAQCAVLVSQLVTP